MPGEINICSWKGKASQYSLDKHCTSGNALLSRKRKEKRLRLGIQWCNVPFNLTATRLYWESVRLHTRLDRLNEHYHRRNGGRAKSRAWTRREDYGYAMLFLNIFSQTPMNAFPFLFRMNAFPFLFRT